MRVWLGRVGIAIASLLLSLLAMEAALALAASTGWIRFDFATARARKTGLYTFDTDVGWRNRPGFDSQHEWPHRSTREKINRDGWRDRDYPLQKDADAFRIAVLGCSFTYGYGVDMEESYSHRLEDLLNANSSQTYEVMNFGVNGYGTAQMVLNYEKFARRYRPDLVILQLFSFNAHRALYTNMLHSEKPTYALEDGRLVLLNHPVPEDRYRPLQRWLLDHSLVYDLILDRQLRASARSKKATKRELQHNRELHLLMVQMLARLHQLAQTDGAALLVLTDQDWLETLSDWAGVEAFDLHAQVDIRRWSAKGEIHNPEPVGHWSPLGNDYVAHAIFEYLSLRWRQEAARPTRDASPKLGS